MFNGRLVLKTAPASEPLSTAEVKLYSRVGHAAEDTVIAGWITAARIEAENFQKKSYITQTRYAIFDDWPNEVQELPLGPLQSVTSIKYYDVDDSETVFADTNYYVDTLSEVGRVALNDGVDWPTGTELRPINSVVIEYVTGFGAADDVPENVKNAICVYCAYMYENREGELPIPDAFYDLLRPERLF